MASNELSPEALKVIEKVQKLLALAGNNPNEHEAAAASQMALNLLATYNLDMLSVENNKDKTGKRSDTKTSGGLYRWQRDLWYHVSQLHFCMYWSIKGKRKGQTYEHRILGRQENVIGCKLMAEYLQATIERLARERVGNNAREYFTKSSVSFREGCASRIAEKLADLRRERLEADERKRKEEAARARHPSAAPGTALILADAIQAEEDANNDYLRGEGWSARRRAERAAAEAVWAANEAKVRQWEKDHPEEHKANQERAAKEQARFDKEEARRAKRRKGVTTNRGRAYKGDANAYWEGWDKGKDVGLDTQISSNPARRVG